MIIDLWGEIPEPGKEKTPFAILHEQASLLQKKTKLLRGRLRRVKYKEDSGHLCYMLEIVAPKLDYSFGVLIISYDIDAIYPVKVEPLIRFEDGERDKWASFLCASKDAFLKGLKEILGSNEVKKVIQRLLAHIILEQGDEQTDDESEE